ncbi:MAG: HAD family phosphatase [Verrucomicrobia bacterium]|nr:HAD family phosphatase [Verrucomicrobiota bacterium]
MDFAVFFDFDGVIADSERLHHRAYQLLLGPLGLGFSWDVYRAGYIGYDDRDVLRLIHRDAGIDLPSDRLKDLMERKADLFAGLARDEPPPLYPGVRPLLDSLRSKARLALCSGAMRGDIDPILRAAGLEDRFDTIVTAEDVPASKPDPACYRLARTRLHARAGNAGDAPGGVAIEDTPAGIESARGAGLRVLAVCTTHGPAELAAADRVTDSLAEVNAGLLEALATP